MKVACSCLPAYGHFHAMVPLARALAASGHEVAFVTAADFCPAVEAAGFAAFAAGIGLQEQLEVARLRYPQAHALPPGERRFEEFVPRMLAGVAAPARLADMVSVLRDWKPDVLLHDEAELAGPLAAAVVGIPHAAHSVGVVRPAAMLRLAAEILAPLATTWGTEADPCAGLFSHLYLDVCPPSMQSPRIHEVPNAHPLRPMPFDHGRAAVPGWITNLPAVPTVYLTLGTVFNRSSKAFAAVIAGLCEEKVNIIVTVGKDGDPEALGPLPAHVTVARYIPQSAVLPRCDAVISQGGWSTFGVLAHAIPLVLLPQGANQFHTASACVASGAARRLLPSEVSPGSVRAEVRAALDRPEHRRAAQRLAAEIAAMPGPRAAVRRLEDLA